MANGMTAKLVYDGGLVLIPEELGTPRSDQMQGTPAEQLCELAGRCCYDSLGKGRASFDLVEDGKTEQGYHSHIKQVGHGSVWEHFNLTVFLMATPTLEPDFPWWALPLECAGRPGVFCRPSFCEVDGVERGGITITANLRAIAEWETWSDRIGLQSNEPVGLLMRDYGHEVAPHIIDEVPANTLFRSVLGRLAKNYQPAKVAAEGGDDFSSWVTMFLSGSRGFSHELVRHGDFTAISQRSTRFVDESDSPWIEHPLITVWMAEQLADNTPFDLAGLESFLYLNPTKPVACEQYKYCVATLEPWLISRGVDKTSARKQARGAARGYLGNALQTEVIFSANIMQWKNMLRQRASVFADAEIREVFFLAFLELQKSRYADSFADWEIKKSPDGIGHIVVEPAT